MRLAAIDIGSNASRLLIDEVLQGPEGKTDFVKMTLVRVPLRLGFDVFENGFISERKTENLVKTIEAYKLLLDVYEVDHYIACATSAMRDATNAKDIIEMVSRKTGVNIKIITGEEEATFIFENHIAENLSVQETYLYIDVGGGSTELTFFSDGVMVAKESFNIGTIRLLKNQVGEQSWNDMKAYVRDKVKRYHHITCIGSGGNINKIFSLSKKKEGKYLTIEMFPDYY